MKKILLFGFISIAFSICLQGQVPAGYYDGADGQTGLELKNSLYSIIKNHNEYPYSSSSTDVWDILKESDRDKENSNNVILFYTGWSVDADQEYNNGAGWNREHVWAKSRGDFGTSPGPGTDAHHIRPTDINVNAARDTRWFDNCSVPYLEGGKETGCFTSNTLWVWQPRDAVKGDVARIIFYMATRYEGENSEPDLEVIDLFPADDRTKDPVHAKLSTLLAWHREDTIDAFELNRNEVIYSYQNNRNPFIDHPEYAERIWGSDTSDIPTNHSEPHLHNESYNTLQVFPNPFSYSTRLSFLNPNQEPFQLIIYDSAGRIRRIVKNITEEFVELDREELKAGLYIVELRGTISYRKLIIIN